MANWVASFEWWKLQLLKMIFELYGLYSTQYIGNCCDLIQGSGISHYVWLPEGLLIWQAKCQPCFAHCVSVSNGFMYTDCSQLEAKHDFWSNCSLEPNPLNPNITLLVVKPSEYPYHPTFFVGKTPFVGGFSHIFKHIWVDPFLGWPQMAIFAEFPDSF